MLKIVFCLAALMCAISAQASDSCSFGVRPSVIERRDDGPNPILLEYWDLGSTEILSRRALPDSSALAGYKATTAQRITTDPMALLGRYILLKPAPADLRNITAVAANPSGRIKPAGCLESLLLDIQIQRDKNFAADGSEFIAYFLTKDGKLRVYFLTNDADGIRGAGFNLLLSRIEADKDGGWDVLANLHNHSFFLEDLDSKKPQGVLAPSANDVKVLGAEVESLGLKAAYITNGFHTLSIPSEDLGRYAAAER